MRLPSLVLLLATSALTATVHAEDQTTHWRLFVSDKTEAKVSVVDLEQQVVVEAFALTAPASVYANAKRSGVFAVQGDGNVVTPIRTGIAFEDHGEHADFKVSDPELVEANLSGERPVHFVEHDGKIAIFFDGSGKVSVLDGEDWLKGEVAAAEFDTGKPHHGVAVPWHDGVIASKPVDEDGKLPSGFKVFDAEGVQISETELCADVHGEASSGHLVAFGCSDGVAVASGDVPEFKLLPFPEGEDRRVGSLLGGNGLEFFLGNYGTDKLVLIEADAAEPFRFIDLPAARTHFVLDPSRPRVAYIMLANGTVHELDVVSGALTRTATITEPYSTEGGHGVPTPRLAVAGDTLVVTDPAKGVLHLVSTDTFKTTGAIEIGGTPNSIAAAGGTGESH